MKKVKQSCELMSGGILSLINHSYECLHNYGEVYRCGCLIATCNRRIELAH